MLYAFGKWITGLYIRIAFRLRFEGMENIPADKGYIIACNHRSYLDPVALAQRVAKPIHYMAKAELFSGKLFGWTLRHINAFPVARGTGDTSAINHATEIIRNGGVMGLFPEGGRGKSADGRPGRARSGVALVAAQTHADVLPAAICFDGKLRFRSPVTVRYGQLIPFEELQADAEKPSSLRFASKRIMADILALWEKGV